MEVLAIHALLIFQPITVHSELALEYSSLLRTSIGVPAESQIDERCGTSVTFDHKTSISVGVRGRLKGCPKKKFSAIPYKPQIIKQMTS